MEIDPSDEEEEEEEEIPLKRGLRASRATIPVAPTTEGPEESSSITHSSKSIPPTPEDEVVLEAPDKEEETPQVEEKALEKRTIDKEIQEESERKTETNDEAKYQRERRRKAKQPAKRIKKKARNADMTVKIQEPIQVPFTKSSVTMK